MAVWKKYFIFALKYIDLRKGDKTMLGINSPKVLAKGEYAQAVRKAALAAKGVKANNKDVKITSKYPYKFEWVL